MILKICRYGIVWMSIYMVACQSNSGEQNTAPETIDNPSEVKKRTFSLHEIAAQSLKPDEVELIDTVFVSMLDSILNEQLVMAHHLDSQLVELPIAIEQTEERIIKNTKSRNSSSSKDITDSWNKIINGELQNLERFKKTHQEIKSLKSENESLVTFMKEINRNNSEDIAYFIVEATYKTDTIEKKTTMLLDPKGELLKEFEFR